MKKRDFSAIIVSATIFILGLNFISGCNTSKKIISEWRLPNEITLPESINLSEDTKEIAGKKLSGESTIYQTTNGEILISFKNHSQKSFILQTNNTGSELAEIRKIKNAELLFLKEILLLNDLDEKKLVLYCVNSENYSAIYSIIPEFVKSRVNERKEGYGLAFYNGTWANLNEKISLKGSIYDQLYR